MMHWDFRVIRRIMHGRDFFQLHRVIYSDERKLIPVIIESNPMSLVGIDPRTILSDVNLVCDAFEKPTIYVADWEGSA